MTQHILFLIQRITDLEKRLSNQERMDTATKTRLEVVSPVGNAITIRSQFVGIDGSGTVDTITAMNDGFLVTLRKVSSNIIIDNGGNLHLSGSFTLDNVYDTITLRYDKTLDVWLEIARSNNT